MEAGAKEVRTPDTALPPTHAFPVPAEPAAAAAPVIVDRAGSKSC